MILYSNHSRVIHTFNGLCARLTKIHNGKYDYTYSVYRGVSHKICVRCPLHGDFYAYVGNHLKGHGCAKCATMACPATQPFTKAKFVENAINTHGNRYTYDNFVYTTAREPSYITCSVHGDFRQSPDNHARLGNGCPHCSSLWVRGNYKDKPSIVYIIRLINSNLYKIGITSQSVALRNIRIRGKYAILHEFKTNTMNEAYKIEQYLLALHKEWRYTESRPLASGNTELVTELLQDIPSIVEQYIGNL